MGTVAGNAVNLRTEVADLLQQNRKMRQMLEVHFEASRAVSRPIAGAAVGGTLDELTRQALRVTGSTSSGFAYLLSQKGSRLGFVSATSSKRAVRRAFDTKSVYEPHAGVCGEVAKTGRSIVVPDVPSLGDTFPATSGVQSQVSVPVRIDGSTCAIGVLTVASYCSRDFTELEIRSLESLGYLAAAALIRERLQSMAIQVFSQDDKSVALKSILAEAAELLQVPQGGFYEFHQETQELELVADIGQPEAVGTVLKVGEGVAGFLVANNRDQVIVDDYSTWTYRSAKYARHRKYDCVLGVLLTGADGRILGTFSLDVETSRGFTPTDADLLRSFADLVQYAFERTKSLSYLNQLREDVRRIVESMMLLDEPREILQALVDLAKEVLRCDILRLYLPDSELEGLPGTRGSGVFTEAAEVNSSRLVRSLMASEDPVSVWNDDDLKQFEEPLIESNAIRSLASAPVRAGNQRLGVLLAGYHTTRDLSATELESVKLLATHAAVAMRHIQLRDGGRELLSKAAHQFKTPLNMVRGNLERLIRLDARCDKEESGRLLEEALKLGEKSATALVLRQSLSAVMKTRRLAQELFDVAMISRGEHTLALDAYGQCDVSVIAESIIQDARLFYTGRPQPLSIHADIVPACLVRGDATRLENAISILVDNAVMYAGKYGPIELVVRPQRNHVFITLSDCGPGLQDKDKSEVFARHRPVRAPDGSMGNGIGLFLVRQWIEEHGGDVSYQDRSPGPGAQFTLRLPRVREGAVQ